MGELGDLYHQIYADTHPIFIIEESEGTFHIFRLVRGGVPRKVFGTPAFASRKEAQSYISRILIPQTPGNKEK
jgi:hypothetical protein